MPGSLFVIKTDELNTGLAFKEKNVFKVKNIFKIELLLQNSNF